MKKIITLLTGLLFIFSGFYLYSRIEQPTMRQVTEKISVHQLITAKDKETDFKTYQIEYGKTALDLLNENSKIILKGKGVNAYIISINGEEALSENREYWAFYINGKMAEVGAGSYKLKSGDKIEWKIEKY